ncbi:unnamed protein product [Angiostrongylus costaricensis]|uniref:SRCR domain-containing protein n=1 Tax=Angiostrongylus costaricensis TaxID=334426 RepID=A0A0R3PAQ1_ANGCS|nr:unnamed protein product [Angiostrongylus costaricensis]
MKVSHEGKLIAAFYFDQIEDFIVYVLKRCFVWQEEWLQYRCGEGGVKEFLGCITETGIFIRNGDMKLVDGAYIQCKKHEDGSVVLQSAGRRNNTKCKDSEGQEREEGSDWKEGSLQFKCGKGGVKNFMGCITKSERFIPYGEVNLVNGKHIKCEKLADGTIKMNIVSRSKCYAKCRDNEGRGVTEGFKWRVGSLQLRCGENGVELMGCVTSHGIFIPSGEVKSVDGYNVKCERSMDGLATMKIVGRSTCIRSRFKQTQLKLN